MIVEVALPLPVDRPYSYAVPERLRTAALPGARVMVPFGARRLSGVVVGPAETPPVEAKLKEVLEVLDEQPALTEELLRLTRWIADYYVCGWGEAIRAALPPGDARPKTAAHLRLADAYGSEEAVESLIRTLRGEKQMALVRELAAQHAQGRRWVSQPALLERTAAGAASLKTLESRGVVVREDHEIIRDSESDSDPPPAVSHTLHPAQQRALEAIAGAVAGGRYAGFLLHGVTGSGKTEVYIEALKAALRAGRSGIVLVPEIALTPQTVGRFRAHFGNAVAVLHSRMSPGERFDAWRQLRDGRLHVAIGPRSAVLAPLSDLGLIIVDEEHESSYKQADPAPRYHARDVAVMRAHLNDAVCVLGSATPGLESWVNAESGKYRLLEMPERVPVSGRTAAPLPAVRIVNLVRERKRHQLDGVFSKPLLEAIAARIDRREQVILLQNRRGFAPVVECRQCGWVPECPDCSVSFTYHKATRQLKCHYCGRTRRLPARCENCVSDDLGQLGAGTQRVEEELQAHLPEARILRMDLDTTTRKRAHHRLLSQFRRGEADVLLGTQMVAKGLDFPKVTLVGVVNADTGLLLPDFRADEHTFQLLTQVAGRAGRADLQGEVILQTRNPDNPVLRYAAEHDYRGFVDAVLTDRRTFRWPPYARLVVVAFSGPKEERVRELAEGWTHTLREAAPDLIVLDAVPALVGRVKRRHRYRTVVKVPRGRTPEVQSVLREVLAATRSPSAGYRITIDVDAVDVL